LKRVFTAIANIPSHQRFGVILLTQGSVILLIFLTVHAMDREGNNTAASYIYQ